MDVPVESPQPLCDECGGLLVEEEDIEEGLHFFCTEFNGEEDEDFQPDEGGEGGY